MCHDVTLSLAMVGRSSGCIDNFAFSRPSTFMEFLIDTLSSGVLAAALIAALAYLCKSQISNWLSKDLESKKTELAMQLEFYKTSLISDVERMKASREIEKAVAIKFSQHQFEAINQLIISMANLARNTTTTYLTIKSLIIQSTEPREFQDQIDQCLKSISIDDFSAASHAVTLWLKEDEILEIREYNSLLAGILEAATIIATNHHFSTSNSSTNDTTNLILGFTKKEDLISLTNSKEAKVMQILRRYAKNYLNMIQR